MNESLGLDMTNRTKVKQSTCGNPYYKQQNYKQQRMSENDWSVLSSVQQASLQNAMPEPG
jgi:hypothetical protein